MDKKRVSKQRNLTSRLSHSGNNDRSKHALLSPPNSQESTSVIAYNSQAEMENNEEVDAFSNDLCAYFNCWNSHFADQINKVAVNLQRGACITEEQALKGGKLVIARWKQLYEKYMRQRQGFEEIKRLIDEDEE